MKPLCLDRPAAGETRGCQRTRGKNNEFAGGDKQKRQTTKTLLSYRPPLSPGYQGGTPGGATENTTSCSLLRYSIDRLLAETNNRLTVMTFKKDHRCFAKGRTTFDLTRASPCFIRVKVRLLYFPYLRPDSKVR